MKNKLFNVLAIISTLGICGWVITDFYGGMIIYLLSFWPIVISVIIGYLISLFETLISLVRKGWKLNKIKVAFHGLLLLFISSFLLFQSELFKSKRILTGILKDDLYHYILILRENGECENEVFGMFGYKEIFHGKYIIKNSKIIFQKKPYNNDFLPDTLLIDKKQHAIFLGKDAKGNFSKKKSFLNYFEIITDYD